MKVILCQAVGDSSLPDSFHGFKYHSYTHAKNVYDAINVIKVGYGALYFLEIALTTQLLYSNVVYCCLVSNGLIIFLEGICHSIEVENFWQSFFIFRS